MPAKQAYLGKSLADWARWTGVQIKFPPSAFPVNSVKLMRGCLVLDATGQLPAFAKAGFEAYTGRAVTLLPSCTPTTTFSPSPSTCFISKPRFTGWASSIATSRARTAR